MGSRRGQDLKEARRLGLAAHPSQSGEKPSLLRHSSPAPTPKQPQFDVPMSDALVNLGANEQQGIN
jgi:hypothetical protein